MKERHIKYHFFKNRVEEGIKRCKKELLLQALQKMLLIRQFELRAEFAYQHGKIGGFFHSYIGQEAIQTAAVYAMGVEKNWWVTSYRCHGLALLLGATPKEVMAELYGKASGNASGRGGSMHMYADRMLGGFGIVGGHVPVATGAGFSLKYQKQTGVAICFLGDGAFAQGAIHESLNIASLWALPCIYIIENNHWGMGTASSRALCKQPIAEHFASAYNMNGYTLNGMDFFNCYEGFSHIFHEVCDKGHPILVEVVTERFRGHSISDPGLYRSKQELERAKKNDPIPFFASALKQHNMLTDQEYARMEEEQKEIVLASITYADESPPPQPTTLEEGVFAP